MHPRSAAVLAAGLLVSLPGSRPAPAPAPRRAQLTVATIHAAALSTPRSPTDSMDEPFLLVSQLGPAAAHATARLPEAAHLGIREDQALGAQPLLALGLEPGDSVRLLLTLLEGPGVDLQQEAAVAAAGNAVLMADRGQQLQLLTAATAPLTAAGAHWLGSFAVLLTNEGGTLRWRGLECLATCTVLAAPSSPDLPAPPAQAIGGVVELTGSGATYHLNLRSRLVP